MKEYDCDDRGRHRNSPPRAAPEQQGKSHPAGVSALGGKRVKQTARGTIHPKKSDHNRAKTIPRIICDLRGALGIPDNERKDPKFVR